MADDVEVEGNHEFNGDEGDEDALEKHLSDNYTNVKSNVSYLSPRKIYLYYKIVVFFEKIEVVP